jgi:hypothetical protein
MAINSRYITGNSGDTFVKIPSQCLSNVPTTSIGRARLKESLLRTVDIGEYGVVTIATVLEKYPPAYKFTTKQTKEKNGRPLRFEKAKQYFMYCPLIELDVQISKLLYGLLRASEKVERCIEY